MAFMSPEQHRFADALARLAYCNPFLPERIELEREALGADFVETDTVWHIRPDAEGERPNVSRLMQRAEELAGQLRTSLAEGAGATGTDCALYGDLVLYLLYHRFRDHFRQLIVRASEEPSARPKVDFWDDFLEQTNHFLAIPGLSLATDHRPGHVFAVAFQVRRAFEHIFSYIVGGSMSSARLRAAVWQSIFTHDMRRYYRSLYKKMGDFTTLIIGESGTGKELVARAIGLSRYVPFDPESGSFVENFAGSFHALSISALSPTLIESELFGHRRGSFTGASSDRAGWLEVCQPLGTVFLDEIGDLESQIQVKLLRALQTRTFQRLGDTETRHFQGKIIAATNRDLGQAIKDGKFREDLYYRLCSDLVVTPPLREQLGESPGDLHTLISFITRQIDEREAEGLTREVEQWIAGHLGPDYLWPGNFRELEQCVRNVLIRREYRPPVPPGKAGNEPLIRALREARMTADELLRHYCTVVYAQTGNYGEAARRLELDRRTVRSKVDPDLLAELG